MFPGSVLSKIFCSRGLGLLRMITVFKILQNTVIIERKKGAISHHRFWAIQPSIQFMLGPFWGLAAITAQSCRIFPAVSGDSFRSGLAMSGRVAEEKFFEILSLSGEVLCTVESLSTNKAKQALSFPLYIVTSGVWTNSAKLEMIQNLHKITDRASEKLTAKGTKGGWVVLLSWEKRFIITLLLQINHMIIWLQKNHGFMGNYGT